MSEEYDVFISYRRDGGCETARIICERLMQKGIRVFFDVETLRSGRFNDKLLDIIKQSKDVIVVLGPNSLERCRNEDDWFRREIACAISCRKNIIPVAIRGFEMPKASKLPADICEIVHYNGIKASHEFFDAFMERLLSFLSSKVEIPPRSSSKPSVTPRIVDCLQKFTGILTREHLLMLFLGMAVILVFCIAIYKAVIVHLAPIFHEFGFWGGAVVVVVGLFVSLFIIRAALR